MIEKKKIGQSVVRFLLLTGMGIYLGMASLYFAGCGWGAEMIDSYYRVRWIAVLNIIPVVLLMYLVYLLVNRMWLTIALSSAITMGLTWVNYYKLQFRGDPLLFEDLTLVFESKEMAGKYNIILLREMKIVILVVLVVTVLSAVLIKKRKSSGWFRIAGIIGLVLVFYGGITTVYSDSDVYNYKTENLGLINQWSATHQYLSRGFVYPFLNSIQYSRMTVPESYNKKEAMKALEQYKYADIPEDKKVNVIGIMLEAYNDFSKFPQIEYNVDIYEELHNIQAESYSGELTTNIFAGGTVNTERAFLTGFTTQPSFRKKTNTYVRYFAEQGYTVEGSHPCYDWFYNRKNINENLGFENYYFYENRYGEMAEGRIAEDAILMPDIIKCFEENKKTDKPYFNFSVTYQNHGPYSLEDEQDTEYVKKNPEYTEETYAILNNYAGGIYRTNQELRKMIDYFSNEEEPVVLILFGDHNPWMGDNNSVYEELKINLDMGTDEGFYNYYNTPYIIWGNDAAKDALGNPLQGDGPNIGPYFLMNEFFKLAGFEGNEFMQASNQLKAHVPIVNSIYYVEDGKVTKELKEKNQNLYDEYTKIQYYWITNYKK